MTAASVQESHPHDIAITQEAPNYSSADARRRTACRLAALLALVAARSGAAARRRRRCPHPAAVRTCEAPTHRAPADPTSAMRKPTHPAVAAAAVRQAQKPDEQKPDPDESRKAATRSQRRPGEGRPRPKYVRRAQLGDDVFAFPNDRAGWSKAILRPPPRRKTDEVEASIPYAKYPRDLTVPAGAAVIGDGMPYAAEDRDYPPMRINYEPLYVVHRRLHFEEKNAERYGWDLGIIQPLVSAAYFYKDVLLWPNSLASGVRLRVLGHERRQVPAGQPDAVHALPAGADHHRHRRRGRRHHRVSRSRSRDRRRVQSARDAWQLARSRRSTTHLRA